MTLHKLCTHTFYFAPKIKWTHAQTNFFFAEPERTDIKPNHRIFSVLIRNALKNKISTVFLRENTY